ncbi:hypothetical protein GCM10011487_57190 [Steroidobacter agaridevorans]|uniref:AMP-binding enzyme C-terminal domain-containing protein n=2 Tax=Steroidobacter agaridevorans TaxID=2695856 RepID=A0A829YKJ7_9GAMM|nr:hypothetical protein GCM10011487_57190 [Steroidobacter agaridevorans]
MLGYLNATEGIDEDGWHCTGDLVEVDGEWIMFRGRCTDIINVGGQKVAPVEVEQVILQLDFVQEVIVRGEPHALLGQIVTAKIRLSADDLDIKEAAKRIRAHCQRCLPRYKVPMNIVAVDMSMVDARQKLRRRSVALD